MSELLVPLLDQIIVPDPLDRGLVGEWRFERDTGSLLPDYSGNVGHGSFIGAPVWTPTTVGMTLDFDGANDGIGIEDWPTAKLACAENRCTVEFYAALDDTSQTEKYILNADSSLQYNCINIIFGYETRKYETFWKNGDARTDGPTLDIGDTSFHHIIVSWDGINLVWCCDGLHFASYTPSLDLSDQVLDRVYMGCSTSTPHNPLNCKIALFRLYSRPLSEAEAAKRYAIVKTRHSGLHVSRYWDVLWGIGEAAPPPAGQPMQLRGVYVPGMRQWQPGRR